jgi:hypothetical protein
MMLIGSECWNPRSIQVVDNFEVFKPLIPYYAYHLFTTDHRRFMF